MSRQIILLRKNYCDTVKGDKLSKYDVKAGIVIVQFYG